MDAALLEPVDDTVPPLSLSLVFADVTPFCWPAAWNSAPRNCWSAAAMESLDVVPLVLDVESVEVDAVAVLDVSDAPEVLIPSDASAAAMACASGSTLDVPDEVSEDCSASLDDASLPVH
jgi:hypothetical protein